MSERSRNETLLGLSEDEPRTAIEVAHLIGKCERLMYLNLSRLYTLGLATYIERRHKNSNNKTCTTRCWAPATESCAFCHASSAFMEIVSAPEEILPSMAGGLPAGETVPQPEVVSSAISSRTVRRKRIE